MILAMAHTSELSLRFGANVPQMLYDCHGDRFCGESNTGAPSPPASAIFIWDACLESPDRAGGHTSTSWPAPSTKHAPRTERPCFGNTRCA